SRVRYCVSHTRERVQNDFADAPLLAADLRQSMARVLMGIGQYGSAVAELQQVLRKRRESLPGADPRIAAVLVDLGQAHYRRGDMDAAARSYDEAMARRDQLLPDDPLRLAIESGNARLLAARGQQGEALDAQRALLERWSGALPAADPALLELRRDEVHTLMQLGRRPEARTRMQALLPVYEKSFGENAPAMLAARLTFANLSNLLNDYEVSLREAQAVADERERSLGHDHPDTLQALALVGANRVRLAQEVPAFAEVEIAMRELLQRQQ